MQRNKLRHAQANKQPGGATCIVILLGIALLASLANIELASPSAKVTSIKSQKPLWTHSMDRIPGLHGSGKKEIQFSKTTGQKEQERVWRVATVLQGTVYHNDKFPPPELK